MSDREAPPGDAVLDELRANLEDLDDQPVGTHPDALDRAHQVLVAELEAIAVTARSDPPPA